MKQPDRKDYHKGHPVMDASTELSRYSKDQDEYIDELKKQIEELQDKLQKEINRVDPLVSTNIRYYAPYRDGLETALGFSGFYDKGIKDIER